MPKFVKKVISTFHRDVEVFHNGASQGELSVDFYNLSQTELDDIAVMNDVETCRRVIAAVGDIPVEGADRVLSGQEAIDCVLDDAAAVACCFREFLEAMKGGTFRNRGSRKGR